jgi:hypothetical protein
MKKVALAFTVALAVALAGCTPLAGNSRNIAAIEDLQNKPMPGFEYTGSDKGESACLPATYCSANATLFFTSTKQFASRAEFCRNLIPWAKEIGADSFIFDPDYIAVPFIDNEGTAQFACLGANNFALVGSSGDTRWTLAGGVETLSITTVMSNEVAGALDDPRLALKSWDQAMSELTQTTKLDVDILSAIETYRLANPEADPTSVKNIQRALKEIKLPENTRIIKDKFGKAHYVELPENPDVKQCLNITPFNPDFFLMESPGNGFVPLMLTNPEGEGSLDVFGATDYAACLEP